MNKAFGTFLFFLFGITFLLAWGARQFSGEQPPTYMNEILLVLSISTFVIFYLLRGIKGKHPEKFVTNYLLSTVLKILLGGIFVFVILKLDPPAANSNALFFMVSYLFYTVLEIVALVRIKTA